MSIELTSNEWLRLADIFGLHHFVAGRQIKLDSEGKKSGFLELKCFWVLKTSFLSKRELIVVVAHTSEWTRGLAVHRDDVHAPTVRTIDLTGWDDPVIPALRTVNLIYDDSTVSFGDVVSYDLVVSTKKVYSEFSFHNGWKDEPNLEKLWDALWSTANFLISEYKEQSNLT